LHSIPLNGFGDENAISMLSGFLMLLYACVSVCEAVLLYERNWNDGFFLTTRRSFPVYWISHPISLDRIPPSVASLTLPNDQDTLSVH
jgi:hypothetical protein